ncbi:hydroxyphenylacetyl-CoA thioesterase PaaI [Arthrobacter wenxiniae]|jgi:acyl-CoA thioesterase|uniref:Hydroxyphenylacetyl-CoA thioesterase PaaI n=1 Tax=Arthrobacter wenxiniae TaxID=2713570 RepID=A0A7Y7IDT2_9MICC|nr:hydroxyphenylacetyl-CoA thioesterase PaaI [Arthrobacter wenxiniae]NVM93448.1 hydroxyphenylacetyl-CoA thioesterase PaaI [Arthrobacter wenxiniae]
MGAIEAGEQHPILLNDHASEWLGIEVLNLDDGHATIAMTLRPEMMNGFGITHGGMIFAFADSAFALACNSAHGDDGLVTVASGADVTFLAPTRAGQRITAVASRRQQQGRSGLYDVQVIADDGGTPTVVAEFRGRSRTIPNRHTN